jgi:hypothetical protein
MQTVLVNNLAPNTEKTLYHVWETSGVHPGTYLIRIEAEIVPGETDTTDNIFIDGPVRIRTPGDLNNDGIVDIVDVAAVSAHWYPNPPIGPYGYDPNFDLNNDGKINVQDTSILSAYWTGPPRGPLAP